MLILILIVILIPLVWFVVGNLGKTNEEIRERIEKILDWFK